LMRCRRTQVNNRRQNKFDIEHQEPKDQRFQHKGRGNGRE
jgi:hypothetical protein